MRFLLLILISFFTACSTSNTHKGETVEKKYKHDVHLIKGVSNCTSDIKEFYSDGVSVKFNQSLCSIFEYELDSMGDTVLWYLESVKEDSGFRPVNSFFKVYKQEKVVHKREMSFVTLPSYKDKNSFMESTYYKIMQSDPHYKLQDSISPKRYYSVLITIKKK